MNSLRTRLLLWLLGAVLLIGVAGGFVIYRNSLTEANAFFDYHLRETALLLRDQAYGFAAPEGLPQEVPQYDFVVQVWSLDGQRLYQSQPRAVLPVATTLGLSTVDSPAGRWRVFGVIARGHVIQVAQALKVREERAARLALRTLAPFGVLIPALALLIWWIVGRALQPLGEATKDAAVADDGGQPESGRLGLMVRPLSPQERRVADLRKAVSGSKDHVALLVQRDDSRIFVPVELG